jgi:hypothetical protein
MRHTSRLRRFHIGPANPEQIDLEKALSISGNLLATFPMR